MSPTSVLLVDDDPDILESLSDVLNEEGFAVQVAQNGREALELLGAEPPALILLDLTMPVMDGREFGARIRSCPDFASTPIILLSADRDVWSMAQDLRAAGCFSKPFDVTALLGLMHSAVAG